MLWRGDHRRGRRALGSRWWATRSSRGWSGLEAMSGIPGLVGATPIQNVGAYGAEVSELISTVRTLDRIHRAAARRCSRWNAASATGRRDSRPNPAAIVVLVGDLPAPAGHRCRPRSAIPELARALGVEVGARAPAADVRQAVLALRRPRAWCWPKMTMTPGVPGPSSPTRSSSPARALALPDDAPRFGQADGMVKTSAAWLIEQAGFAKGYGQGSARLSSKHTLALTNRGGATAADLLSAGTRDPGGRAGRSSASSCCRAGARGV